MHIMRSMLATVCWINYSREYILGFNQYKVVWVRQTSFKTKRIEESNNVFLLECSRLKNREIEQL